MAFSHVYGSLNLGIKKIKFRERTRHNEYIWLAGVDSARKRAWRFAMGVVTLSKTHAEYLTKFTLLAAKIHIIQHPDLRVNIDVSRII